VLHNLAGTREQARLRFDRCEDWEHLHDLLGHGDPELLQDKRLELDLEPYGYCWLRVHRKDQRLLP
jgi:hypothetical protein